MILLQRCRRVLALEEEIAEQLEEDGKRALMLAGGEWENANGHRHQADTRPQWRPDGWAAYVIECLLIIMRQIDGKLVAASKPLRRMAQELYGEIRPRLSADLKARRKAARSSVPPASKRVGQPVEEAQQRRLRDEI